MNFSGIVLGGWLILATISASDVPNISDAQATSQTEIYPRILHVTFYSNAMKAVKQYSIVLPNNYDKTGKDWPVLYLLHGRGRNEKSLVDIERNRNELLKASYVIVLPQGDDGWYIDSPVISEARYEKYTEEVIKHSRNLFNLSKVKEKNAIAGWSMGGYGAIRFAERHAKDFSSVTSIIGLLDFPTDSYDYTVPIKRFGTSKRTWREYNPINGVANLVNMKLNIITATDAFDRPMNDAFVKRLKELNITYTYKVLPGRHTFAVVQTVIPQAVAFHEKLFFPELCRR